RGTVGTVGASLEVGRLRCGNPRGRCARCAGLLRCYAGPRWTLSGSARLRSCRLGPAGPGSNGPLGGSGPLVAARVPARGLAPAELGASGLLPAELGAGGLAPAELG